ncbi:alkaline phosphatase, partial [Neisseria meningitidis]
MMDLDLLSEEARREMLACAEEAVPSEMCGVLVFSYEGYEFLPLSNCAENPHETFEISADDWMAAERVGEIVAVVHSHPRGEPFLSGADRWMQVETGLPWILVTQGRLKLFRPVPHLRGRVFEYGKTDCGALVRDAFMLMGLVFPDHPRGDMDEDAAAGFWEKHLENCGFSRVSDGLCAGDVVLTAT